MSAPMIIYTSSNISPVTKKYLKLMEIFLCVDILGNVTDFLRQDQKGLLVVLNYTLK